MAGAIAELKNGPLKSDNQAAASNIEVHLVEAGPRVLPTFSPLLSKKTVDYLVKLGVKVHTDAIVKEVKPRQIILKGDARIPSEITIWAAGVTGEPAMKKLNIPNDSGRITVEPSLQVTNYPQIFAIGDIAGARDTSGRFLPMVAPVAMQQARFVAKQIDALQRGEEVGTFRYRDKGSMATIGRHKAVVEVGPLKLGGAIAWYAWLWLHLFYLLGGRNKIGTMADWTWNYLTFDRGNRHIIDIN
jgi:NADH dehydrogenase